MDRAEARGRKRAPRDVAMLIVYGGEARMRGKDSRMRCWSDWRWEWNIHGRAPRSSHLHYISQHFQFQLFEPDHRSEHPAGPRRARLASATRLANGSNCAPWASPRRLHTCDHDDAAAYDDSRLEIYMQDKERAPLSIPMCTISPRCCGLHESPAAKFSSSQVRHGVLSELLY